MTAASRNFVAAPALDLLRSRSIMVLMIDDQLMVGEAVRRALLSEPEIAFHFCVDPAEALSVAKQVRPTVILQDLVMPGIDGLDLVRAYRADPVTCGIPVIVMSSKEEAATKRDAFLAGANDYLVKLPDSIELLARIRYHSRAYLVQVERDAAYRALRESQQRLQEKNLELERLTNVDGLTGLSNKRYFSEYAEAEWRRAARSGGMLSVLMIDVDHFKLYNDTYGHVAGDVALKRLGELIRQNCRRSTDLPARFGGEEFVVVLPGIGSAEVKQLGEALVHAVDSLELPHAGSPTERHLTISAGAACAVAKPNEFFFHVLDAADQALYKAKALGRNRVVLES